MFALLSGSFHTAAAQSTTSLQTDATVLPRRSFDVQFLSSWTRFDQLLGNGGQRNLGASFNVDSLTGAQIPGIPTNSLIQSAAGVSNLQVTAGSIRSAADSRIVTAPIILEYGLTRRLTLGVVVPLVETRTTFIAGLNIKPGTANVGLNPAILNGGDWSHNKSVVDALTSAASALQGQLAGCQAAPSGSGCQALLAQQGAAMALIATTSSFANSLALIYGTGNANPGTTFVPITGGNIQQAIDKRLVDIVTTYQQSFGTTVSTGALNGASIPANDVLNAVLLETGYDTLQSPDRSSIGDISIGATYQLSNTFPDSIPDDGFHQRVAVNATGRIGTGEPANRNRLFDNPTGYGQPGLVLGAAGDFAWGRRWEVSALGSYTMQFGSVDVSRVPNTAYAAFPLTEPLGGTYSAGNVLSITVLPRIGLARYFSINGVYSLVHVAADQYLAPASPAEPDASAIESVLLPIAAAPFGNDAATLQQIGFGFSYSTSQLLRAPGRIPAEVSFRHFETLSVFGGPAPKAIQDQITLRIFFH
ncbi:MAG TPA: hypothetical protein VH277_14755 [Gemmatimonadaceae bacterium]|nr:hypothetical protein [Gemmatimonadaceae bacterium]